MRLVVGRRALGGLDHVRRRPDLRVPATEVDERVALTRGFLGDAAEQLREVLLGKPLDSIRTPPHRAIVRRGGGVGMELRDR